MRFWQCSLCGILLLSLTCFFLYTFTMEMELSELHQYNFNTKSMGITRPSHVVAENSFLSSRAWFLSMKRSDEGFEQDSQDYRKSSTMENTGTSSLKNILGLYSSQDPSMNVSVYSNSSGVSKLSPYLNIDPHVLSEPEFILPEGASRQRGRLEYAFGTIGGSVVIGAGFGGVHGLYRGLKDTQNQPIKIRRTQLLNYIGKHGASAGNGLGVVALMYSGIGVLLSWARETDDEYNTLAAATTTGLLYKSSAGLKRCGIGGAVGFGLAALYTLWTKGSKDRSIANYIGPQPDYSRY